jgi:hypothetical protein
MEKNVLKLKLTLKLDFNLVNHRHKKVVDYIYNLKMDKNKNTNLYKKYSLINTRMHQKMLKS